MAGELAQIQDKNPIVGGNQSVATKSIGSENLAKVLGNIAERSVTKAGDYADEASKSNLLQTHGMLQDVEAQSKIDILRSPEHAESIAKNAENTLAKIKSSASLNRGDRRSIDEFADNTIRSLKLNAAEKSISLIREQAKFAALSTMGDTLQSIRRDIHINPEQADKLIEAQYASLAGNVRSGIITAVEAANIHKQFSSELEMAHELVEGIKSGALTASDMSAYHATETGQIPLSNAHLPMDHSTAMVADHHFGQYTSQDIQAKMANGERVTPQDLVSIKSTTDLDKILNYGIGAARATGDLNSGKSWVTLQSELTALKKKEKKSAKEQGYQNRLNNFFNEAEKPGFYQNFIAGTPEGARIQIGAAQTQAAIDKEVFFGSEEQVNLQRFTKTNENLNDSISKSASLGIGMNIPDHLRQPIPLAMLNPIQNGFNKDGDITSAINNIQTLSPANRVYAMNAFPGNYRKQMTVYEVGNLSGKADQGFLVNLMASQQVDALGEKPGKKDSQDKFLQLATDRTGYSDSKLAAYISPSLSTVNTYLGKQPNGGQLVSSKIDQAMRYIKYQAAQHNDYKFEHIDDYIKEYSSNMDKAYGVKTGFNYVMDTNNVPLEDSQMQVLAAHGENIIRQKLAEFKSPAEIENIFSTMPPIMVSSPGGRIEMVYPNNQTVVDKHGHPAFSEIYSDSVWHKADEDIEAKNAHSYERTLPGAGLQTIREDKTILGYLRSPKRSEK